MSVVSSHLESLYSEKFRSLVGFARRRLPQQVDPEDVVQASFLKILERVDLDSVELPASYLIAVVQNEVIARLREESIAARAIDRAETTSPVPPLEPTEVVEEAELAQIAATAARSLPARQKRILVKYLSGMSPAEIAQTESSAFGSVNPNQVSMVLSRTMRKLKKTLAANGLLSMTPLGYLRTKLRGIWVRLDATSRLLEAPSLFLVCAVTVGQLAIGPAPTSYPTPDRIKAPSSVIDLKSGQRRIETSGIVQSSRPTLEASNSDRSLTVLPAAGRQLSAKERDEADEQNPSMGDQLLMLIQDPGQIPLPECGGPPCP
jgi:RNA polymerase sigma factor (sigma-70 family)